MTVSPAPRPSVAARWPRGISGVILVSGVVLVVTETSNLLFFVGLGLLAAGGYGWIMRDRRPSPEPSPDSANA